MKPQIPIAIHTSINLQVIGEDAARKVKEVPLSDTTVRRRIQEMSDDIEDQLVSNLKDTKFSIQLDESTDITNKALLLVFVKFHGDDNLFEDILFCKELEERTTGEDVFNLVDGYMDAKGIEWRNCVGVCTDGAAAMTGKNSGVVKRVLERAPDAKWIHCYLHRENLAAKKMSQPLSEVMSQAVKIINFFKSSALNSRLFEKLCERMESDHIQLLYFSEIRWLSRGKALNRLVELRHEVAEFLREKKSPLAEHLCDASFVSVLAYMADIFNKLNELNTSMQGKDSSVFHTCDKVEAFKLKVRLWQNAVDRGHFEMFPTLSEAILELESEAPTAIISEHLQKLSDQLNDYFKDDLRKKNEWIRDPFNVKLDDPIDIPMDEMASLMEVKCDGSLKAIFREHTLEEFWLTIRAEYPALSDRAVKFLLPFCTTWLCESGFSVVVATKTKARNRLSTASLEANMRVALSPITPRIDRLIKDKQIHPSH